jgi:hypothetical protein
MVRRLLFCLLKEEVDHEIKMPFAKNDNYVSFVGRDSKSIQLHGDQQGS